MEDEGEHWPWGLLNLKRAFSNVDADGGGEIDVEEFTLLLKKFGLLVSETEAIEYMALIDEDSSGNVTFQEFLEGLAQDKFLGTPVAEVIHKQ
eukprot:20827-Prorocentrum_minimum.AAC.2